MGCCITCGVVELWRPLRRPQLLIVMAPKTGLNTVTARSSTSNVALGHFLVLMLDILILFLLLLLPLVQQHLPLHSCCCRYCCCCCCCYDDDDDYYYEDVKLF